MKDDADRERVRSRTDILELVRERVALKKAGKNWKGLCPFHDDRNPSFYVSPEIGRYRCWSCGAEGDVFTWVMKTQALDFPEALSHLAKRAGIELSQRGTKDRSLAERQSNAMDEACSFFRDQLRTDKRCRQYCEERGLDDASLIRWEIGASPVEGSGLAEHLKRKGHMLAECKELFLVDRDPSGGYYDRFRSRLMFPIRDERGELIAFGGRAVGDIQPKYINSGDTPIFSKSRTLYGLDKARKAISESGVATLAEGYLDVIACHRSGVETAVATLGTSLSSEHVKMLQRWCKSVTVLYDGDEAGQKAAARACDLLMSAGVDVRVALVPEGQDPDTVFRSGGAAAVNALLDSPTDGFAFRLDHMAATLGKDTKEYVEEAAKVVAGIKDVNQRAAALEKLVLNYPFARDRATAVRAVNALVKSAQRAALAPDEAPMARNDRNDPLKMSLAERDLFLCVLDEALRREAWESVSRPELFLSPDARQIAKDLTASLADPPDGPAADWLHLVEPEETRAKLARLAMAPPSFGTQPDRQVTADDLEHARIKLESNLKSQELRRLRVSLASGDEESLAAISKLSRHD